MKKLKVFTITVIFALLFVACSASVTTANFKDVQMASEVDESTYEPITETSEFYTDTPEIFVTGTVDNAPEGTLVGAEWIYLQDGEELFIDGADLETEDTKTPVVFSLEKPTEDWPVGDYIVNLYIDKEVVLTLSFNVIEHVEEATVEPITAKLTELQVASEVDDMTWEPISITNTFSTDSPVVYVTGSIDNVTPIQIVRAEWFYVEGGANTFMDEASIELVEASNQILFNYGKPTDGWPVGEYAVDIYIDDIYMDSVFFMVE
ncbi:MAG: hypothetical protein JJE03_07540 [Peptostreptococcaceae bacterium]|nr:hypothetical protein [Peptostreptococcaceae bacterium]